MRIGGEDFVQQYKKIFFVRPGTVLCKYVHFVTIMLLDFKFFVGIERIKCNG